MTSIRKVVLNSQKPIPDTGERPSNYGIDGYIHIEDGGKLFRKIPIRRVNNGGVEDNPPPAILEWENPDEPLDYICLRPTFKIGGVQYKVEDGDLLEVEVT
jgi:hypothetical protein